MQFLPLVVGAVALVIVTVIWLLPTRNTRDQSSPPSEISVQVLVLGDVGRSPRMQYHALSVAQHGGRVDLIGYQESPLLKELDEHDRVSVVPLSPPPKLIRSLPFIISGPMKVIWQIYNIFVVLGWRTEPSDFLLVQNPPSIPTLAVAAVVARLRSTALLIDWHNYGWSILAGTRGASHPFVSVSKIYESVLGRFGDANLTVTRAMARQLRAPPYNIASPIAILHDRPAAIFQPSTGASDRRRTLSRILQSDQQALNIVEGSTRLIVSSTSWTPDEDFGLLLDALVRYATGRSSQKDRPPVLAIITGKGPQKALYEAKIAKLKAQRQLEGVEVKTAFLPMEDYASLLACADLGVCLHMSSSGVDLPMKVVDMFGAGLPVAAYSDYESFPELVRDGINGRGFTTAEELAAHLVRLLGAQGATELKTLKDGAVKESHYRWADEWDVVVGPMLGFQPLSGSE